MRGGGSYISQNDLRVHFGLGPATARRPAGTVRWPSGLEERWSDLAVDRILTAEGRHGARAASRGRRADDGARCVLAARVASAAARRRRAGPGRRDAAARSPPARALLDQDRPQDAIAAARRRSRRRRPAGRARCSASRTTTRATPPRRSRCSQPVVDRLPEGSVERREAVQVLGLVALPRRPHRRGGAAGSRRRASGPADNLELASDPRHRLHPDAAAGQGARGARARLRGGARVGAPAHLLAAQMMIRLEQEAMAEEELRAGDRQGPAPAAGPLPARPARALPRALRGGASRCTRKELELNPATTHGLVASSATPTCASRGGTRRSRRCSGRSGSTRTTAGPTSCSGAAYMKKGEPAHGRGACCGARSSTTPTTRRPTTCSARCCSRPGAPRRRGAELDARRAPAGGGPAGEPAARVAPRAAGRSAAPLAPAPADWRVRARGRGRRRRGSREPSVYGGLDRKRFIIETNGAGVAWSTTTTTAGSTRSCSIGHAARGGRAAGRARGPRARRPRTASTATTTTAPSRT